MRLYLDFTQKTGQQLLDEKKKDTIFQVENIMLKFRNWVLESGKSESYAKSATATVRSFYSYFRVPLVFRKHDIHKLSKAKRSTSDYLFSREDLSNIALAGSLKERYVLLVGKSLGLRVGDFCRLTFGRFRSLNLDLEPPICLGRVETEKERVPAYPFLDADAIPIVKLWLDSHKGEPDSARMIKDKEQNLSTILQSLFGKAGYDISSDGCYHGAHIRFHNLRKFLIDRLSAYAGESQWKQIVGKTITEGAYVSQDQLRGIYMRAMKDTLINGNGVKTKKLIEIEQALVESQKQHATLSTTVDFFRKELFRVTSKVELLDKYIGLADVHETEDDYKKLYAFFEKIRWEKELKQRTEQHLPS